MNDNQDTAAPTADPVDDSDDYAFEAAASFAQQRLWFLDQLEPGSPVYNISMALRLRGSFDVQALQTALNNLVRRHETLRTTFDTVDKQTVQVISETGGIELQRIDASTADEATALRNLAAQPFNLRTGPLFRATLLENCADGSMVLLLVIHHIIADAWSLDVLYRELVSDYASAHAGKPTTLDTPPIQYADYAEWQQEWLSGAELDRQLTYWRERLADAPELLELPLDYPRPRLQTHAGATVERTLNGELAAHVKTLAQQASCTLFAFYLSAFGILLSRYGAASDVVVGTPIAGRQRTELENLIGFFVNTLAMRVQLEADPTFAALLKQTQKTVLGAYAHQDLPFEKLVEELQPERVTSHAPVFQVLFVLHHALGEAQSFAELDTESILLHTGTAKFDLTLFITESQSGTSALIEYSTDLFTASTIERMLDHLETLLGAIAAAPDQAVSRLPLLSAAEREHILTDFNATAEPVAEVSVNGLVEQQAARTPDAVAVAMGAASLSYAELNARANTLARQLQAAGAGPGTRIGVCMTRSPAMAVGVLAVLKAGAAYVPLDPNYPPERLAVMLEDSQAVALLTQTELLPALPEHSAAVVLLDDCSAACDPDSANLEVTGESVYLIYTSGSTGTPKGVELTHAGLSNLIQWQNAQPGLDQPARTLQFASLSFDVSFQELFTTWAQGGTLVLVSEEQRRDLAALAELIARDSIERVYLPFAALQPLADAVGAESALGFSIKDIIVAGEQLQVTPAVINLFNQLPGARLHNHYGPSETHVVTALTLAGNPEEWPALPAIGTPVANTTVYVLDQHGEPVPVGVPGELYLGGVQVAKGYWQRPELNAERFIKDAFSDAADARLYRTGDRVRFLPDGTLEYLGRTDAQVKWRGFRIEPGEIETALAAHPDVQQAAVLLREDTPGDKRLVGYVVPTANAIDTDALRAQLKTQLPDYMVPSTLVVLDALPLTPSGKLARRALPVPDYQDGTPTYVAPRTPVETALTDIWGAVLNISKVGIHDDFFTLGGHSLLATQLISRVRDTLGVELPLMGVFDRPTVAEFAALVNAASQSGVPPLVPQRRTAATPLSFAQQRLWFLDQLEPGNPAYNFPVAVELTGTLDQAALAHALNALTQRHESLRTRFVGSGMAAQQEIVAAVDIALESATVESGWDAQQAVLTQLAQVPFDLSAGPLLRAHLLSIAGTNKHILLLVTHHIVSDGWSLDVMLTELARMYAAQVADTTPRLTPLPVQYADYALWQQSWLQGPELDRQVDFWRSQLADMPPLLDLPLDKPRPQEQSYAGSSVVRTFGPELQQQLRELAAQERCTLYMVLLAAFDVLLATYASTDELVVGTPIAGRQHSALEGLIGYFSNTLAIPARLENDPSFSEFLALVKRATLDSYAHQDLPFEKLVEELQPERAMSHAPIFQVMFVLQNAPSSNLSFGTLDARPIGFEMGIAKFDLLLEMAETDSGLRAGLQYNTDLFTAPTIERMLDHLETLLGAIAAAPDQAVSRLPLLSAAEREHILTDFNATAEPVAEVSVNGLVEQQAARTPDAVAVAMGAASLSYAELNARANTLARQLQAAGAGPGTRIGVCMTRSPAMAVGVLAVLKAGAAYVPLDPNYPPERLAVMLEDSQAVALLTQTELLPALPEHSAAVVLLDDCSAACDPDSANLEVTGESVYLIYTSGSTGTPKGVELTHAGLSNLIQWQNAQPGLDQPARTLQFASLSFDVSFQELFTTWAQGGTLVLVSEEQRRDLAALAELIARDSIERVYLPFAALQPLADAVGAESALGFSIKDIIVAGEQLQVTPAVINLFNQLPGARLHNHYGPSETHVVTALTLAGNPEEWPALPAIGTPVANTTVYVLDQHGEPVPVGVPGELYLGGVQVAKGYWQRPELNAERFIKDAFSDAADARLYRTGDRVRFLPDGTLEYLGRTDAQVKWRGFRIEPGEIETALAAHPDVQQAAVLLREDTPGDKRLVGYVVPTANAIDTDALRAQLKTQLPDYMVPSTLVVLDALPLTPSGKLARRALPVPDYQDGTPTYVAPRTPVETALTDIWGAVLNISKVGIHDDFFTLGGHSLLATQLISRVRDTLGVELPLKYLFRNPTPETLAAVMAARELVDSVQTTDANDPDDNDEEREQFEL